jgi:two-component system, LuxR family, response regulator FixJ
MTMASLSLCFWIVDDDLSFGRSLSRQLTAKGMPAEYFGSAQSFLDSVPPWQSGYAIVNIQMPECDGFTLLKKMRALLYFMPVIFVSEQPDSGGRELTIPNGAVGYLQKPFSEESLLEMVHSLESDKATP